VSRIPDLRTALEIVQLADQPNGGLNVDAWHLVRSGPASMSSARCPGPHRGDPARRRAAGPRAQSGRSHLLHARALPGDGEFDLPAIVGALRDTGTTAPVGVEVFSDSLHQLSPEEAARSAAQATRRVMETVG